MERNNFWYPLIIIVLTILASLFFTDPQVIRWIVGIGGATAALLLFNDNRELHSFLSSATDKKLRPKKTIELTLRAGNNNAARQLLDRCIRYRIEDSGNYAWGLAFWMKPADLPIEWKSWCIHHIHGELGLKLHKELERIQKFFEENEGGLSIEANQEYIVKLLKKELATMLEVCGEDKPYASFLPILAQTSVHIREEIFRQARTGRQFPKDAELTEEMLADGNKAYQGLLSQLEEEVRTWPVAAPVS